MSTAQVTTTRRNTANRSFVRYGTPDNFTTLGVVRRVTDRLWEAESWVWKVHGQNKTTLVGTRRAAVSRVVTWAKQGGAL